MLITILWKQQIPTKSFDNYGLAPLHKNVVYKGFIHAEKNILLKNAYDTKFSLTFL